MARGHIAQIGRNGGRRAKLFTIAIFALVMTLAGIVVEKAFAASDNYCNFCTLPSSGTPAVSSLHHWSYNSMATGVSYDEQIFLYDAPNDVRYCSAAGVAPGIAWSCGPSIATTARCHLLNGNGPATAGCYTSGI